MFSYLLVSCSGNRVARDIYLSYIYRLGLERDEAHLISIVI